MAGCVVAVNWAIEGAWGFGSVVNVGCGMGDFNFSIGAAQDLRAHTESVLWSGLKGILEAGLDFGEGVAESREADLAFLWDVSYLNLRASVMERGGVDPGDVTGVALCITKHCKLVE